MTIIKHYLLAFVLIASSSIATAQNNGSNGEVGENMKVFIQENHIEDIENMVHKFTSSKIFINYLLEQGHHLNADSMNLQKSDVNVGSDIDIYVKHFTAHQNYTMLMVPVYIAPLQIYDTLLFSVIEVSDKWLREKYYSYNVEDDSIKSSILAIENHELLTKHMYDQVLQENDQKTAEIQVKLHESYITTNSVSLDTHNLDQGEREKVVDSWGLLKRTFSHNLELNVEMNIYIFGHDAMEIIQYLPGDKKVTHRITPESVFKRHHFEGY